MDDSTFGKRNRRGDWSPLGRLEIAPVFVLPPRPLAFLKWLPGYFLPSSLIWAASAVVYWYLVVPAPEATQRLALGWVLKLFLVSCVLVFLFNGAFELRI
jgi:hypothetical protein